MRSPSSAAVEVPHGGAAAARNRGLVAASGSLVAYLDDDNELHPSWLAAVVWAFGAHPDHDVLYGARLIDDWRKVHGLDGAGWPWVQLEPFDRRRLEQGNIADMGVLAHRSGHPAARFDESLAEYADWDLFLALTATADPLRLPAIACRYHTAAPERMSGTGAVEVRWIREKWGRPDEA
jgi:glycosyltransferase involved in cell wall biosynthesis